MAKRKVAIAVAVGVNIIKNRSTPKMKLIQN
jgi:hypothetical protein